VHSDVIYSGLGWLGLDLYKTINVFGYYFINLFIVQRTDSITCLGTNTIIGVTKQIYINQLFNYMFSDTH
jgi:hypothetical protein